jgi:hypothetical protein
MARLGLLNWERGIALRLYKRIHSEEGPFGRILRPRRLSLDQPENGETGQRSKTQAAVSHSSDESVHGNTSACHMTIYGLNDLWNLLGFKDGLKGL